MDGSGPSYGNCVWESAALSATEKAPEQSGKADVRTWPVQTGRFSSHGVPVLVWRRPGGSGLAKTTRGRSIPKFAATLLWRKLL